METNIDDVPEMILADILTKLPLRIITISKVVCKRWKSLVESVLFRNHFISLYQNSSSSSCSWSLFQNIYYNNKTRYELIASYGCARWGLPRSLGSYISAPILDSEIEITSYVVKATSSGLVLIQSTQDNMYYVVNPMSREWVKITPCTQKCYFHYDRYGLATHVDESNVVLGYKIVIFHTNLSLLIYTSETGQWTYEKLSCRKAIPWSRMLYPEPISFNNILHWIEPGESHFDEDVGGIIAVDMYNREYKCLIIPFPNQDLPFRQDGYYSKTWYRRACTTSGGFIMYINMVSETKMKVWRLKKDIFKIESLGDYWELLCEIELGHVGYIPMVMHPFDTDIVYLWSPEKNGLVLMNLRKQDDSMIQEELGEDSDGCIISSCIEKTYVIIPRVYRGLILSPQFFPSVWIDSVPRSR